MRVLAIDHGEKRLGIAISDPTGTIARPLMVIQHTSRDADVAQVLALVQEYQVERIVIGISLDDPGQPNPAGRRALNFARTLKERTDLPVEMWDEAFSTQEARIARIQAGVRRKKRQGHLDEWAAAMILQSYLEAKKTS
ncbi:MAG: Holliday junction resolvase RuvX [Anaerolineales bacterium]